jgi:hypothetical protein
MINVALRIRWLSGQNLMHILVKIHCFIAFNIRTDTCYELTEVLWSENKLLHCMQK